MNILLGAHNPWPEHAEEHDADGYEALLCPVVHKQDVPDVEEDGMAEHPHKALCVCVCVCVCVNSYKPAPLL